MAITLHDIELAVFDLDDTLYVEYDFVIGGLRAVADDLAGRYGGKSADHYHALMELHNTRCRDKFQVILTRLGGVPNPQRVGEMVAIYRTADRELHLQDDADRALSRIRRAGIKIKSAILTDGPIEGQKTKVALLGLAGRVDYILFTAEHGRDFDKPSVKGFRYLGERFNVPAGRCVYIADNERKDFAGPNRLNWQTVKIIRPNALYSDYEDPDPAYRPDNIITSFDELEFAPR